MLSSLQYNLTERRLTMILNYHPAQCVFSVYLNPLTYIYVLVSGNHKLTATAKVIVKICEHEVGMWFGSEKIFIFELNFDFLIDLKH